MPVGFGLHQGLLLPLCWTGCVELAELHNLFSDPGYADLITYPYMFSEGPVVPQEELEEVAWDEDIWTASLSLLPQK